MTLDETMKRLPEVQAREVTLAPRLILELGTTWNTVPPATLGTTAELNGIRRVTVERGTRGGCGFGGQSPGLLGLDTQHNAAGGGRAGGATWREGRGFDDAWQGEEYGQSHPGVTDNWRRGAREVGGSVFVQLLGEGLLAAAVMTGAGGQMTCMRRVAVFILGWRLHTLCECAARRRSAAEVQVNGCPRALLDTVRDRVLEPIPRHMLTHFDAVIA